MNSQAMMGVGGEDDKLENGSGGGGGFFESFKVTGEQQQRPELQSDSERIICKKRLDELKHVCINKVLCKY